MKLVLSGSRPELSGFFSGLLPASPQGPAPSPSHLLRLFVLFILWAFILVGQLHGSFQDPHQARLGGLGGLQALDGGKACAASWGPVRRERPTSLQWRRGFLSL